MTADFQQFTVNADIDTYRYMIEQFNRALKVVRQSSPFVILFGISSIIRCSTCRDISPLQSFHSHKSPQIYDLSNVQHRPYRIRYKSAQNYIGIILVCNFANSIYKIIICIVICITKNNITEQAMDSFVS